MGEWQLGEPLPLRRAELVVGPLRAQVAYFLNGARGRDGHFIVVATQYPSALCLQVPDAINDFARLRAIAHHIAQERELLRAKSARVRQAGLQGLQIAVDVGEQRQFHDQRVRLE